MGQLWLPGRPRRQFERQVMVTCHAGKADRVVTFIVAQAFVSTGGEQCIDQLRMAALAGFMQWSIAALLRCIDVCTLVDEGLSHVERELCIIRRRGAVYGANLHRVPGRCVHVGADTHQVVEQRAMAKEAGIAQRVIAIR